ncbi:hypothetical protein ZEAMMB73_Zm00001d030180 [Zea mays]|jgi:hypothetical protein|uniref:Uncharacterized protein n=1 Tax=Zea mays TaxID=4577 RepID=A0A1D6KAV0_MAIZE|nr:hypothetical protein ZEAMMB73_Zm00001d030180 [Zea mays]
MMIGSNARKQENAPGGRSGKPPHWRRREQVSTAVYVVHPTQFRAVVQQLTGTGADSPTTPLSTHAMHQRVAGGGDNGAAAGTRINAVAVAQTQAQAQHGEGDQSGGSSRERTLGQMRQDCLDWANDDDDN